MEFEEKPRKSISTSRSFGKDLKDLKDLKEAISSFITIASEKLRKNHQLASIISIFLTSNPFKEGERYSKVTSHYFTRPTANTVEMIKIGLEELKKIYKPGILYKKAGVILQGLIPEEEGQFFFFESIYKGSREEILMKTIDNLNKKFGRETIKPLSNGITKPFKMRQLNRSPNYTTRWEDIPIVKTG
ncbi:MAG: DUF4113 domain-containing protein [Caldisericia bacterium]|nr:DUF4113 domain-containing protein [Caldisericia bacterium]